MVQTDQDMSRCEDQTPSMPTPIPLLPYIWAVIPLCMAFLSRGRAGISWDCLLHCSFLRAQLVSVWPFCLSVPRRCMFSRHLLSGKTNVETLGVWIMYAHCPKCPAHTRRQQDQGLIRISKIGAQHGIPDPSLDFYLESS